MHKASKTLSRRKNANPQMRTCQKHRRLKRKITKDMNIKEDPPHSSHKEYSIMIMISQDMNSEGLQHKEDHSLMSIKVYFMVIVLFLITLDIKL